MKWKRKRELRHSLTAHTWRPPLKRPSPNLHGRSLFGMSLISSPLLSDPIGKDHNEMAWYPGVNIVFDVNRESLVGYSLPPFRAGDQPSASTTRSRYRLRWNQLAVWDDFGDRVSEYWNTVPQADRNALVANQGELQGRWQFIANNPRILSEDDIKQCMDSYPIACHLYAANGAQGAPLPSDIHCVADRCSLGASQWGLAGVPDFVMHHLARVTVVMEVKNPWLVTPQSIDEVLDSIVLV